jgi:hypothetical protein
MTDYTDVPAVTSLHDEAERTQQALDMLAAGGTMSTFTIAPPTNTTPGAPALMMAVQIQVTDPISPEMETALNDWLNTRLSNIVAELATYGVGPPPPPITDPPVNTVAPVVTQVDPNLTCTTGTWDNDPSSYSYQWAKDDGTLIGGNYMNYPITFADVGTTITCTVTATNTIGSTQGPPSNGVVVTSPATVTRR